MKSLPRNASDDRGEAALPLLVWRVGHRNEYAEPAPREFNLSAFLKACKQAELDVADVLAFAEIDKPHEELTMEDRPALLAAIKAMSKASGAGAEQRVSLENDVSNDPAPAPEETREEGET